ncbi:hypothetical protein KQI65_01230 [bacterium]|nr:hypothetical protein [bacterium]
MPTDFITAADKNLKAAPPRSSMVFIIHGDADYTYHTPDGQERQADRRTLQGARNVARQNKEAEVYIFHQRPAQYRFFVVPIPDGEFLLYRNGAIVQRDTYWRGDGSSRFDAEVELYRQFPTECQTNPARFFFYFGHEISEFDGAGYDESHPERTCNVREFSEGLRKFTGDSLKFDLLVLSTCFGGTPYTIGALGPYTRTVVASPDNLHLSYFDLQAFARLGELAPDNDIPRFAASYARHTFNRLAQEVQTAVTVAVYDMHRSRDYLSTVERLYARRLSELQDSPPGSVEYVDCSEEKAFVLPGMRDGVTILFRPAIFGRSKSTRIHSGWQCCRAVQPPDTICSDSSEKRDMK